MATGDKILVSSSQYDVYSKLLAIASKYTDINDEDFFKDWSIRLYNRVNGNDCKR